MQETLEYKNLKFDGKAWDNNSIEIIRDMLEVWDCEHRVVICHPNCIFANQPVNREKRDFDTIDWQDLKEELKCTESDSYVNLLPDCQEAFKYLHRRFRHELFDGKTRNSPRHLVVVQIDKYGTMLIRGIFRGDEKTLKVAESPLYSEFKVKSIWDRNLRWTEHKAIQAFIDEYNTKNDTHGC